MRDSVVVLAQAVDTAVRSRRARSDTADITRHAAAFGAGGACTTSFFLTGLGSAWHSLYEFGAYQNALRELRRAIKVLAQGAGAAPCRTKGRIRPDGAAGLAHAGRRPVAHRYV